MCGFEHVMGFLRGIDMYRLSRERTRSEGEKLTSLIPTVSFPAGAPHAKKTTPLAPCSAPVGAKRSTTVLSTAVVNVSQPFLLCDAA